MRSLLDPPSIDNGTSVAEKSSDVLRHPFYFSSRGDSLFAWLHAREAADHYRHGVVICPPIGYEHLHSHRALRHLADGLARRNIPTMRFDWSGHGDSSSHEQSPDRVACWLANVRDAVEHLRDMVGCTKISIVGLRLGALLATNALAREDIENVVLWAPVFKGRDFVRELRAIDRMADAPRDPSGSPTDNIEAAGFVLTADTATSLNEIQWNSGGPRCHRILVTLGDDTPVDQQMSARFDECGSHVETIRLPGYAAMMREPHRSLVPTLAIDTIGDWLEQQISGESPCDLSIETHQLTDLSVHMVHRETSSLSVGVKACSYSEHALWISRSPDIFGIVTEPEVVEDGRPTIVLLNAGSSYRIGPGRLNVLLARQFAVAGFRTIRIDLHGLGDSVTTSPNAENDPYPATAFRDVELTLQHVCTAYGDQPQVLMGLCSGAYIAFQSAAQLKSSLLIESILINPLTFFWREGMTIDDDMTARMLFQDTHYYQSLWKWEKWLKLVSGRTHIGLFGAMKLAIRKLVGLIPRSKHEPRLTDVAQQFRVPSHPEQNDLPGDLTRIAAADRKLAMFFASDDPGLTILMKDARATARRQERSGKLKIHSIKHADHTFSRDSARLKLMKQLVAHLVMHASPAN